MNFHLQDAQFFSATDVMLGPPLTSHQMRLVHLYVSDESEGCVS